MKKTFTLILFCLVFATGVNAQKVTFGPMVSAMYNWASYNNNSWDHKAIGGYSLGAFARVKLLKFYLQPEILYSARGSDFQRKDDATGQYDLQSFRYKTVDVNAMFGFQLFGFAHDAAGLRLHTGPGMFFMIDDSFEINDNDIPSTTTFKKNIANWQFGIGVDFTHRLMFDLRYELGLSSIVKDSPGSDKVVPKAFMIQVAYKLIKKH